MPNGRYRLDGGISQTRTSIRRTLLVSSMLAAAAGNSSPSETDLRNLQLVPSGRFLGTNLSTSATPTFKISPKAPIATKFAKCSFCIRARSQIRMARLGKILHPDPSAPLIDDCNLLVKNSNSVGFVSMFKAFHELPDTIGERFCKIVLSRKRLSDCCSDSAIAGARVGLF